MKRSSVLGLGAIALLSLFPNLYSQASYDYTKNTTDKIIQYEKIEQKMTREERAKSVLEQTVWDEKINGTMTINYPEDKWGIIIYCDPKTNEMEVNFVAPEDAIKKYSGLFNKLVDEYKQEEKENKTKNQREKENKNTKVLRMQINSKKINLDPEVNIEYYETEIPNTPLPEWTIKVKDYTNDNSPPEIDIKPGKEDAHMLLNIYNTKKAEHEKSHGKFKF